MISREEHKRQIENLERIISIYNVNGRRWEAEADRLRAAIRRHKAAQKAYKLAEDEARGYGIGELEHNEQLWGVLDA